MGLRRLFFLPVVLVLLMQVFAAVIQLRFYQNTNTGSGFEWLNYQIVNLVSGMLNFITGLFALGWVGMWMGLTTKKPNIAVIKTFVFVQVIPWFVLTILQIFTSFSFARFGISSFMVSTVIMTLLWVSKDIAFIIWARRKLYSQLRDVAASDKRVGAKQRFALFKETNVPPTMPNPT
jgi:hypothetical protein